MFQVIDLKTNKVLGTYTTRAAAYRAINRRFLAPDVSPFVVAA